MCLGRALMGHHSSVKASSHCPALQRPALPPWLQPGCAQILEVMLTVVIFLPGPWLSHESYNSQQCRVWAHCSLTEMPHELEQGCRSSQHFPATYWEILIIINRFIPMMNLSSTPLEFCKNLLLNLNSVPEFWKYRRVSN